MFLSFFTKKGICCVYVCQKKKDKIGKDHTKHFPKTRKSENGNPFATPNEILPEWYLFPTFNLLRILSNKFIGILSMFYLPGVLLIIPFGENLNRYQNPFRRPIMLSIFLIIFIYSIWLSIGPLQAV